MAGLQIRVSRPVHINQGMGPANNNLALWMSLRYLRLNSMHYGSFISWVSIIGLGLGVAVLIVVLSVMNGFDGELSKRILGSVPHIVLIPNDSDSQLHLQEKTTTLQKLPGVNSAFRFFQAEGMISRNGGVNAVSIYGVPIDQKIPLISSSMLKGGLTKSAQSLVMGGPLAAYLGLQIADSVALVLTTPTQYGVRPEIRRFILTGLFEVGAELDYSVVLVNYQDVITSGLESTGVMGIRLVLDDPYSVNEIKNSIVDAESWIVQDWTNEYGELFRAVRLEKRMMFLLLFLIVTVAIFNIVASQTMVVNEKRADIAILRTMGASSNHVLRIFLFQGAVISVIGIVFGLLLGIVLALNISELITYIENLAGVRMLEGTYFQTLPSRLEVADLLAITGIAFFLCLISAIGPARRAARLNPVDSLG